jgi:hypothetical protein
LTAPGPAERARAPFLWREIGMLLARSDKGCLLAIQPKMAATNK